MKARRFGRVINISSGAGLGVSLTGIQAYAAAKAAQIGLTRQLAHELGEWGHHREQHRAPVSCCRIQIQSSSSRATAKPGQKALVQRFALKRLGNADDIAHGVLFFASDYAAWITGQVLPIDRRGSCSQGPGAGAIICLETCIPSRQFFADSAADCLPANNAGPFPMLTVFRFLKFRRHHSTALALTIAPGSP